MIFDHTHPDYIKARDRIGKHRYNGAYYYSKEITEHIIPNIKTDRNWVTLNVEGHCWDHTIFFVHPNWHIHSIDWLENFNDLILICSWPEIIPKVEHLGKTIYLPMSVDVSYVEQFKKTEKTKDVCFYGRNVKAKFGGGIPEGIPMLTGKPRHELLAELADYRRCYCTERCAIEAKILGVEVLPYMDVFPDTDRWQVFDSRDAAVMLQKELDKIDGGD